MRTSPEPDFKKYSMIAGPRLSSEMKSDAKPGSFFTVAVNNQHYIQTTNLHFAARFPQIFSVITITTQC
jgi:hypothetical protein